MFRALHGIDVLLFGDNVARCCCVVMPLCVLHCYVLPTRARFACWCCALYRGVALLFALLVFAHYRVV